MDTSVKIYIYKIKGLHDQQFCRYILDICVEMCQYYILQRNGLCVEHISLLVILIKTLQSSLLWVQKIKKPNTKKKLQCTIYCITLQHSVENHPPVSMWDRRSAADAPENMIRSLTSRRPAWAEQRQKKTRMLEGLILPSAAVLFWYCSLLCEWADHLFFVNITTRACFYWRLQQPHFTVYTTCVQLKHHMCCVLTRLKSGLFHFPFFHRSKEIKRIKFS